MFHFGNKEFLLLLVPLFLLLLAFLSNLIWKKKVRKRIGDEKLVRALSPGHTPARFNIRQSLLLLAFAAGIIAALNPRQPGGDVEETRKGIDVAIALDVSRSMLAEDLAPNRLERAKQFIRKLMDEMPDDRIALVLFAGKAYLQMPLTIDHGAAAMFVSSSSTASVPQQGTVIGEALEMSANAFDPREARFKTIILISDGEDHDEEAASVAAELADQGIMINTIGIGSPQGSTIPDPLTGGLKKDETGTPVISVLNEAVLIELAKETNGTYVRLEGTDEAVAAIRGQLANIERTAFTDMSRMNFVHYYMWFALAMLVLLVVEPFIPETRKR
jgi:Ca-activated chloride channel family protein